MIGGPDRFFEGSERYQYGPPIRPEGRAIEAAKAMKAGRGSIASCSACLTVSIGPVDPSPSPPAPRRSRSLWEKENRHHESISSGVPNGQEFTKTMQDNLHQGRCPSTIYAVEWNRLGDLAETGGIPQAR